MQPELSVADSRPHPAADPAAPANLRLSAVIHAEWFREPQVLRPDYASCRACRPASCRSTALGSRRNPSLRCAPLLVGRTLKPQGSERDVQVGALAGWCLGWLIGFREMSNGELCRRGCRRGGHRLLKAGLLDCGSYGAGSCPRI